MGPALRRAVAVVALAAAIAGCGRNRPETAPDAPSPAEDAARPTEDVGAETEAARPNENVATEADPARPEEDVAPETGAARAAEGTAAEAVADIAAALDAAHDEVRVDADVLAVRDFSPEDYWALLDPILADSPDRFRVRQIGASVEGRPIRRIDFGSGTTTVLLWSQMHGNESTASRSLVDLIAYLRDRPDDPRVRRIESALAITIVPVLNPDGAARFQRHNAVGIDINRDARALATPEGRVLKAVRDEIDAVWGFNLHDQNVRTRLGSSGRDVLIALLAPPPGPGETSPANHRARRMCSLLSVALAPLVGDQVARYDESFNPRAFGDLMAAWGTSTVLIESGGELDDPHKERLRRANFVALLTALETIAGDGIEPWGEDRYFDLPLNAPWVHDVLVRGATILLPDGEPVRADLAINFADSLQRNGGRIEEVGDLAEATALVEIDAAGLWFIPGAAVLDSGGALRVGARATGVLARDRAGADIVYRLVDGMVSNEE